jgi:hypothetical protein
MSRTTDTKILKAVNLSPPVDDTFFDKLENVHPMKQITIASIIQVSVFGFMLLAFYLIGKVI